MCMEDSAGATPAQQTIEQTSIPAYAKPYVEEMLGAARANVFQTDSSGNITGFQPYETYDAERIAQFTPLQQQAFESAQALGPSEQGIAASHMAQQAGLAGLQAASAPYQAGQFSPERVQVGSTGPYQAGQFNAPNVQVGSMGPYQAGQFTPQQVQTQGYGRYDTGQFSPDRIGSQQFIDQNYAAQYMSPYMQNVVDIQQREAQRQADIAGQRQQAEAVRAGAFGGGRDAIMRAEAARNLALQKGDIQAQGLQSAFQQAQAQFNTDQARRMQAAMANQQAGMTAQQLTEQSRQYGADQFGREQTRQMQAALANQQAGLTAQQLGEQSRQFGAGQLSQEQARQLQAALANQQAGMTAQQFGEQSRQFGASQLGQEQARQLQAALANQQTGLEAQRLGEQSRQYGAGFGLSGLETALRSAGTLGQLGQAQFGQELSALQQQGAFGQQQQQQVQSLLQQQYQDFLNQQRYPYQQLGFMSDMLRGLPMSQTTQSLYQAPPSPIAQVAGLGTAIGGASGLAGVFRARGGPVHSSRAGLADLMVSQI